MKNRNYLNELEIYCFRRYCISYGIYNKERIVSLPLDRMALQDIKSLCHQNFSRYMFFKWRNAILRPTKHNSKRNGTIITILFSLFLTASRIISPPPCFAFCFSTIAVMHEKTHKNIKYAHFHLKLFTSFFSAAMYFLCLSFQCILYSQHTTHASLPMEKQQAISKNFLWGYT